MSIDAQAHQNAVVAALNAALAPDFAYDADDVPSPRPGRYVEVDVSRRFGGEPRTGGHLGTTGWRIRTLYVARSPLDARRLQTLTNGALEEVSLTVSGKDTTGILFETGDPIASEQDGRFSGFDFWTYTH